MARKQRISKPLSSDADSPLSPRIIGGQFRGRKLLYSGDPRTRPMKDRVREAVFNLLGPAVKDKAAIDLFAGTGALGLEALSRGAACAVFVEQHFPTAAIIRKNAAALGCEDRVTVHPANTLLWSKRLPELPSIPWVVFCSPPYDFYVDRIYELMALVRTLLDAAPAGSVFAVESDTRFDFELLPRPEEWDIRDYSPAMVGILRNSDHSAEGEAADEQPSDNDSSSV